MEKLSTVSVLNYRGRIQTSECYAIQFSRERTEESLPNYNELSHASVTRCQHKLFKMLRVRLYLRPVVLDYTRLFVCTGVSNEKVTLTPIAQTFQGLALFSQHPLNIVLAWYSIDTMNV